MNMPKCFEDKTDHAIWLQLDKATHNGRTDGFVCRDCTPAFKQEMMLQERCEHPEVRFGPARVKFASVEDVEIVGFVPKEDAAEKSPDWRAVMIEHGGEKHSIMEWAAIRGISYHCLRNRLKRYNWPVARALGLEGSEHVADTAQPEMA